MEAFIVVLVVAAALFFTVRNLRKDVTGGCDCSQSGCCSEKDKKDCCK